MEFYVEHETLYARGNDWPSGKRAALQMAIQKWETIVTFHTEHPDTFLWRIGEETCALCHIYLNRDGMRCRGCPVAGVAGVSHCSNTPFERYLEDEDFLGHAEEELAFLKKVLEEL